MSNDGLRGMYGGGGSQPMYGGGMGQSWGGMQPMRQQSMYGGMQSPRMMYGGYGQQQQPQMAGGWGRGGMQMQPWMQQQGMQGMGQPQGYGNAPQTGPSWQDAAKSRLSGLGYQQDFNAPMGNTVPNQNMSDADLAYNFGMRAPQQQPNPNYNAIAQHMYGANPVQGSQLPPGMQQPVTNRSGLPPWLQYDQNGIGVAR